MSTTVHAYAIHQIGTRVNGKKTSIPASTKTRPSVFVTTAEDLAALVKLGAARTASKEEIAIAKVQESVIDTTPAVEAEPATSSVGDERPATGAKGDPQGTKKAAAALAAAATETPATGATQAATTETPAAEDI